MSEIGVMGARNVRFLSKGGTRIPFGEMMVTANTRA